MTEIEVPEEFTATYWKERCDQLLTDCKQLTLERNDAIIRYRQMEGRAMAAEARLYGFIAALRAGKEVHVNAES